MKYDPAQGGVRLSFALSDWADLGKVYPKALAALQSTRDEALSTYRKTPSDLTMFYEVMSIDLALRDDASAKALFYEGKKNGVSASILMLHLDQVVSSGDMKWAADILGDPFEKLADIKSQRERLTLALAGQKGAAKDVDEMYARQIAAMVRVVAKVQGPKAGRALQAKALLFLDSPTIRNALAD